MMSLIELIEPGEGDEAQNAFLGAVPPINLFKSLAHAPAVAQVVAQLGGTILYQTELDSKVRELAILRAAHQVGCSYELVHHERIGLDVGLTELELAAVRLDGNVSDLDPLSQLACRWSDEVAQNGKPSADLVHLAKEKFGTKGAVELGCTVAYYLMVASFLMTFEVPVEAEGFSQGVDINAVPSTVE